MSNPKHSTYNAGIFTTETEHKVSDGKHTGYGSTGEKADEAYREARDRNLTYKNSTNWLSENSFLGDGEYYGDDD